jgi:hypothetical protein
MLAAGLLRGGLKQAPSEQSADVVNLRDLNKEGSFVGWNHVEMRRFIACSGDWVQVELGLTKEMTLLLKSGEPKGALDLPVVALLARGAVRGWANGTCILQLAPCGYEHVPWSPPAPLPPE